MPSKNKRATLPRTTDFTKDFVKDWERLTFQHETTQGSDVVADC